MLSFFFAPVGRVGNVVRSPGVGGLLKKALVALMMTGAVTAVAAPPVITAPAVYDVYYTPDAGQDGLYFSFGVTATGEPASFEATGLPSWCTFNKSTGSFFGTTDKPGVANVKITATNADGTGTATVQIRSHPAAVAVSAAEGVFHPGETIWFTISFNAVVQVNGDPRLKFRIGADDYREATLDSGSGTDTLRFAYLVSDSDRSGSVMIMSLDATGSAIADANGLAAGTALPLRYAPETAYVEWRALSPLGNPALALSPGSVAVAAGMPVSLTAGAGEGVTVQWQLNGVNLSAATAETLAIPAMDSSNAGVYTALVTLNGQSTATAPAVLGVTTSAKVLGGAAEVGSDILHPNGNRYDQVLLQGRATSITANPGEVTRISFTDLSNDIVQVEFAGAGTLTIALDNFRAPAEAANYNQPGVNYATGHARIVVAGANETTFVSVFSVGRANAVNQSLFRDGVDYDGVADIASIAILSTNGKFGGVFAGNASFIATNGVAGILAPDVEFTQPITIGDIKASDGATPMILLGAASNVRITGGDLDQPNDRSVQVSGIAQLRFVAGTTSHGDTLAAQTIEGRLEENGVDVTTRTALVATQ